jgi:long-chain acyl-CoA synthetase
MERQFETINGRKVPHVDVDTIPKLFRNNCESFGDDQTFMRHKHYGIWKRYTWGDAYQNVKHFGLGLISMGLGPGDRVLVITENSPALIYSCYAVECARAIVATMLPDSSVEELRQVLSQVDIKFAVAEDQEQVDKLLELKDELPNLRRIIYWDSKGMWKYSQPILASFQQIQELGTEYEKKYPGTFEQHIDQGKGEDIIALIFSSGTTGRPKGTIVTNEMIMERAFRVALALQPRPHMQYLSYLLGWHYDIDMGVGLISPFILNFPEDTQTILEDIREIGAELVIFGSRQWESYTRTVQAKMMDANWFRRWIYSMAMKVASRVTAVRIKGEKTSPFWKLFMPFARLFVLRPILDRLGLIKVRYGLVAGTATSPELLYFVNTIGVKLRQLYGSSEIGVITIHQGDRFDINTVGQLVPVHPRFGKPLEYNIKDGELLISGGAGVKGYYKMPEATEEKIKDGWFHTGDCFQVTSEGEFIFLDRVADLRRLANGQHFSPQFIESHMRFCPYIKDAIALGDFSKEFVTAMVNIDRETVSRWMEQRGLSFGTFPELSQSEPICNLVKEEIIKLNRNLPAGCKVTKFVNLPKELDPDEGELTRTRKLRRGFMEDHYKDLIEAIYRGKEEFMLEVPVTYRDGRAGIIKVAIKITPVPEVIN